MGQASILDRLAAAVERTGASDDAGVLDHTNETVPLCDAVRLAERCGLSIRELLGDVS
jgi:hypothetical protein